MAVDPARRTRTDTLRASGPVTPPREGASPHGAARTATVADRIASQSRMAADGRVAQERIGREIAAAAAGSPGAVQAADALRGMEARIAALDSAGDTTHLRITPELKAQGNLRLGKAGAKAQLGARITVTRDSDAPDTTYMVRLDKEALGLVIGEVGADKLGRGGGSKGPSGAAVKGEVGGQTVDAVEMRFATRADAARAAAALQRLHLADTIGDGADLARALLNPLPALPGASGASGAAANPMTGQGAPGAVSAHLAGLDPAELAFLRSGVTAYETSLGTRGRLALEAKLKRAGIVPGAEGRLDGTQTVTRRVELPTATEDGMISYTLSGGLRLSAKERLSRAAFGPLTAKLDNRLELARTTTSITFEHVIPKGTDPTEASAGRPVPEYDAMGGAGGLPLDRVVIRNVTDVQTQGLADPSRGDILRLTEELTIATPEALGPAAGALFSGDFEQAARLAGAGVTLRAEDILRTGTDIQPGAKLDLGLGALEGSVILSAGSDDIVRATARVIGPGDGPGRVSGDDGRTVAVLPFEGVTIRDAAGGARLGVASSGSFLRDTGARARDAEGGAWVRVAGTDVADAPVEGWVRADLLARFDSTQGAMDATGRINPSAEAAGMEAVKVRRDDTLWNLARANGWDFEATRAANGHLMDPALIFAGDTVYVPATGAAPPPPAPVQGESVASETRADPDAPDPSPARVAASGRADGGSPPSVQDRAPTLPPAPVPGAGPALPGGSESPAATADRPAAPSAPAADPVPRSDAELERILATYQVEADPVKRVWRPSLRTGVTETIAGGLAAAGGWLTGRDLTGDLEAVLARMDNFEVPVIEADTLDRLGPLDQLRWIRITEATMEEAPLAYEPPEGVNRFGLHFANDGHVDAYRHILWNARMTVEFGEDWTRVYATAHEKVAGNPGPREAMDLWNNELGRRIAVGNPGASDAELQALVRRAIAEGEAVVLGPDLSLRWSDEVAIGAHGVILPETPAPELPAGAVDIDADDLNTASG